MNQIPDEYIDCVVTSPPYFNIKDYSKDGYQKNKHSVSNIKQDVGKQQSFNMYLKTLLKIWKECYRVLKPNGKLCINVPLLPVLKSENNFFHNRFIYDLQSEIQKNILVHTKFNLLDLYIWNRTNSSKKLMFGSYPYPGNFYAQNTTEFIAIYVKPGKPNNGRNLSIKRQSKLSQKEWIELTKQIWNIPSPNRGDMAYGKHPAIMPIEIAKRCIKLYTYIDGNSHNRIHALNYHKPYKLSFEPNNDIKIMSIFDDTKFIMCSKQNNEVLYSVSNQKLMSKKNVDLLTLL